MCVLSSNWWVYGWKREIIVSENEIEINGEQVNDNIMYIIWMGFKNWTLWLWEWLLAHFSEMLLLDTVIIIIFGEWRCYFRLMDREHTLE